MNPIAKESINYYMAVIILSYGMVAPYGFDVTMKLIYSTENFWGIITPSFLIGYDVNIVNILQGLLLQIGINIIPYMVVLVMLYYGPEFVQTIINYEYINEYKSLNHATRDIHYQSIIVNFITIAALNIYILYYAISGAFINSPNASSTSPIVIVVFPLFCSVLACLLYYLIYVLLYLRKKYWKSYNLMQ